MMDFLSSFATVSAFVISIIYGIGFYIIVFNLSQLGIEEFQIINFKYLFVGFTFIMNHLKFLLIGMVLSLLIFIITNGSVNPYFLAPFFAFATLLVSLVFVAYATKFSKQAKTISTKRTMYLRYAIYTAISVIGSLYPSFVLSLNILDATSVKYSLSTFRFALSNIDLDFFRGITISIWFFFFWSHLTYYSRFYYGIPNPLSSVDRTGIGLPNTVQFIFDEGKSKFISQIGLPVISPGMTGIAQLIETTNDDYIIFIPPDNDPNTISNKAVKISKSTVMAVVYHQDEVLPIGKKVVTKKTS